MLDERQYYLEQLSTFYPFTAKEIGNILNMHVGNSNEIIESMMNIIGGSKMKAPLINQIIKENKSKADRHKEILEEMHETYIKKNADYGDSFGEVFEEFGIVAAISQISHKYKRLKQLGLSDQVQVKDETIKDTLLDLANYSIMTIIELENVE